MTTATATENFSQWARQRIRAMQAELQASDIIDKWAIEGQINQLEIALKWHSIYAAEQHKCIVKVTPHRGAPIYYASIHRSTMDAAIDAMEKFGHAVKISVKRLGVGAA